MKNDHSFRFFFLSAFRIFARDRRGAVLPAEKLAENTMDRAASKSLIILGTWREMESKEKTS
jgi:hypothetical protein